MNPSLEAPLECNEEGVSEASLEPAYALQTLTNPAEFDAISNEWDALILSGLDGHPQLGANWLKAWMQLFPASGGIRLLTVRDTRGALVAGLPLEVVHPAKGLMSKGLRILTPMGACAHMLDWFDIPIVPEAKDHADNIIALLVASVAQYSDWDVLDLPFMPVSLQSGAASPLKALLKKHLPQAECSTPDDDVMLGVGKTHYFNTVKSTRTLRKRYRHIEDKYPGKTLKLVIKKPYEEDFKASYQAFLNLYNAYWQQKNLTPLFVRYKQAEAFYAQIMAAIPTKIVWSELWLGEAVVSYSLTLHASTFAMPILIANDPAYEKDSVGILHCDQVIRHMLTLPGMRGVLLGRGSHGYKQTWADRSIKLQSIKMYRTGWAKTREAMDSRLKGIKQKLVSK
ncbi:MAG: GNAT family N-acetyltransferase [Vampirovibrionales bacterium]|nr:GNAT family N-acetyltransferase [Vampirovibrionales bacterium]